MRGCFTETTVNAGGVEPQPETKNVSGVTDDPIWWEPSDTATETSYDPLNTVGTNEGPATNALGENSSAAVMPLTLAAQPGLNAMIGCWKQFERIGPAAKFSTSFTKIVLPGTLPLMLAMLGVGTVGAPQFPLMLVSDVGLNDWPLPLTTRWTVNVAPSRAQSRSV